MIYDDSLGMKQKEQATKIKNQISKLQNDKQDEIKRIDLDKKDVRVQKTGGGNVDVLNTKTDLKGKPTRAGKIRQGNRRFAG